MLIVCTVPFTLSTYSLNPLNSPFMPRVEVGGLHVTSAAVLFSTVTWKFLTSTVGAALYHDREKMDSIVV